MGDLFIFSNEIINMIINKCTVRSMYYLSTTSKEWYNYMEIYGIGDIKSFYKKYSSKHLQDVIKRREKQVIIRPENIVRIIKWYMEYIKRKNNICIINCVHTTFTFKCSIYILLEDRTFDIKEYKLIIDVVVYKERKAYLKKRAKNVIFKHYRNKKNWYNSKPSKEQILKTLEKCILENKRV